MKLLTVAEIAAECGVTPQGVNAYLRKSGLQKHAIKNGNKFLLNEKLSETVRNHFGASTSYDSESETKLETETEKTETSTNTTETESETETETTETVSKDKTAGQEPILLDYLKELKQQVKIKDEQIKRSDLEKEKLHQEIEEKDKQIEQLITTTHNLTLPQARQALLEAYKMTNQEVDQPIINVDAEVINKPVKVEDSSQERSYSLGQRLSFLFTGKL